MRFRLRTLLIVLALGPPLLAGWVSGDLFQIFLVIGFIAYALVCIVVGSLLGRMVHTLTKLL
jgi:hypothetical protein